jgi:polygalacturonase
MPHADSSYQFYRNVEDFGAVGDGVTDDTAAINMAASSGDRCGQTCGSTTVTGALVYFPVNPKCTCNTLKLIIRRLERKSQFEYHIETRCYFGTLLNRFF